MPSGRSSTTRSRGSKPWSTRPAAPGEREYDAVGALGATVDPTGVRTEVGRSRADGVSTVRDAFDAVSVTTDEFGRPTRLEHADTSAELTTYDACGRPVELVDADGGPHPDRT